jgi:hypothetical protein
MKKRKDRIGAALLSATMVGMTAAVVMAVAFAAQVGAQTEQVCPGTQVAVENLPATVNGVVITLVDDNTAHFDIPEGSTVQVCVKAGSAQQGDGPEIITLTADADVDHSSGKELSHISVISVITTPPPTTPPPTTPPPTTPPPTTPPPVTTTPPPVTTTPPPATTTPPPATTPPPPPEDTTTPPSPVGGPGPGPNQGPPNKLAFTGPEAALPLGAAALALFSTGTGLMYLGRRRRDDV